MVHRSLWGPRGVPRVPGACAGVPGVSLGGPRGVPGCPRGVPRGWDPRGARGRPGHPRDGVPKDDFVIYFHNKYHSVI